MRKAEEISKRDLFHECCGHVLARLDGEFPTPVSITAKSTLEALDIEAGKHGRRICGESINWLADNGYIKIDGRHVVVDPGAAGSELAFTNARLTDKGFAALNIQISFQGRTQRAGNALLDYIKGVPGDVRAGGIGWIVDKVIEIASS